MSNTLFETSRFIEILNNDNNLNNYLKYIVTPITPYLICDHHFSTELYKWNIYKDVKKLLNENTNDLYINKNFDKVKEEVIKLIHNKSDDKLVLVTKNGKRLNELKQLIYKTDSKSHVLTLESS